MNKETVEALFTLNTGIGTEAAQPQIAQGIERVTASLREGADGEDIRLCYLAAALAGVAYLQRAAAAPEQLRHMQRLAEAYRTMCGDLIGGAP